MDYLTSIGESARLGAGCAARLSAAEKNRILAAAADGILANAQDILSENQKDVKAAVGVKAAFIDRLTLTRERLEGMADGLRQIARLDDPVGEVLSMRTLANGLVVGQKRVPLGVVGIIYEARPNVTSDVFGLCLKSGNSVVLRGGKEALGSNAAIVRILQKALEDCGASESVVQLLTDTSRETAVRLMRLNKFIDVLIPRGSAGLIQSVIENSTIPVIETGVGNCHIFVDESADFEMAKNIVVNAKTQRPGVCNACEKLIVHESIADRFLPVVCAALADKGVEIRADERAREILPELIPAQESDWPTEYADYIIAVKVAEGIDAAIGHIQKYSSRHSEAIVTESYANSQKFLDEVDSAAVYVNASTRFTDGFEFGLGAEIGISTQKLHARGPMGLKELTSTKYIIFGSGQIRG